MKIKGDEFQRQVTEATRLGEEELLTQPWAVSAKYDRRTQRLVVQFNKGTILSVPINLVPALNGLGDKDVASVSVLPPGFYLDWPDLDIQVSIAWLLTGMYGNQAAMPLIGRRDDSLSSKAKTTAVRAIGNKSGRPRIKRKTLIAAKTSG